MDQLNLTENTKSTSDAVLFDEPEKVRLPVISANRFLQDRWKMALLYDNRERFFQEASIIPLLAKVGVTIKRAVLPIADFAWTVYRNDYEDERILEFLIERKTEEDLDSSEASGHLDDQLHRLNFATGFQKIFLVESEYVQNQQPLCPRLRCSLAQLQASGHHVWISKNHQKTLALLVEMSQFLKDRCLKSGIPESTPLFSDFVAQSQASTQSALRTVKELWIGMIIQAKGIGAHVAHTVATHFPTPKLFFDHMNRLSPEERIHTISQLRSVNNRAIGSKSASILNSHLFHLDSS